MKKKALTTAVLAGIGGVAGLAGIANAVNINNDGLGQVLIYPYFTVNAGNQTLMSIVNTTNRTKAVKVRFLEGLNSREVLDFNLYLSPFDVWTGSVFTNGPDDVGNLVTRDHSCTVPDIIGQTSLAPPLPELPTGDRYVPFRTFALDDPAIGPPPAGAAEDGPASPDRTREGHMEAIEMAELNDLIEGSASAAVHVQGPPVPATSFGITYPADCEQLNQAWVVDNLGTPIGYWAIDPNIDTDPPAGGIFGAASVVDGAEGTQVSYDADAVAAFAQTVLHSAPGDVFPSVRQADFDPNANGLVDSLVFDSDLGSVIASEWFAGEDAVSAVFMRNQIYNEYALDSDLDASTEWVLTFPTKRFYTDPAIVGEFGPARPPFTDVFDFPTGGACEEFGIRFWDREERTVTPNITPIDFSPQPPGVAPDRLFLCWETNVVRFQNSTQGLGGTGLFGTQTVDGTLITLTLDGVFENGWARIDFTRDSNDNPLALPHTYTSADGDIYNGLPVTGFAAQVIKNGNVGGSLANYAGLFRHKADKDIMGS